MSLFNEVNIGCGLVDAYKPGAGSGAKQVASGSALVVAASQAFLFGMGSASGCYAAAGSSAVVCAASAPVWIPIVAAGATAAGGFYLLKRGIDNLTRPIPEDNLEDRVSNFVLPTYKREYQSIDDTNPTSRSFMHNVMHIHYLGLGAIKAGRTAVNVGSQGLVLFSSIANWFRGSQAQNNTDSIAASSTQVTNDEENDSHLKTE